MGPKRMEIQSCNHQKII